MDWEIYTPLCIKQITSENLHYSTGALLHALRQPKWEGNPKKKEAICVCITDSLYCSAENNTTF